MPQTEDGTNSSSPTSSPGRPAALRTTKESPQANSLPAATTNPAQRSPTQPSVLIAETGRKDRRNCITTVAVIINTPRCFPFFHITFHIRTVPYCHHRANSCVISGTIFESEIQRQDVALHGFSLSDPNLMGLCNQDTGTLDEHSGG